MALEKGSTLSLGHFVVASDKNNNSDTYVATPAVSCRYLSRNLNPERRMAEEELQRQPCSRGGILHYEVRENGRHQLSASQGP